MKALKFIVLVCFFNNLLLAQQDKYPNYNEYLSMMSKFEADYPGLCKIIDFGQSVQGRKLLAAKLSDNVSVEEKEPQFLYLSTIHGNELTGYFLMLRLINHLLENYGKEALVTRLVDSCEIWIIPLANPDGTFRGGDQDVLGAVRYNANNKDLNRNYPKLPGAGATEPPEKETEATMALAESNHFVISAELHTGAELVMYPYCGVTRKHTDELWFAHISGEYVDTIYNYAPSGYFSQGFRCCHDPMGPTTPGSILDYLTYYCHCRCVRLELSSTKMPPEPDLNDYWEWNYRSLLNYIGQALNGIRGTVTDLATGEPLNAKVFIEDHDMEADSSWVYSYLPHGDYYRPVYEGTYDVTFSCPGYHSKTVTGVQVESNQAKVLDVQLDKSTNIILQDDNLPVISIDITRGLIKIDYNGNVTYDRSISLEIYDIHGKRIETLIGSCKQSGSYTIKWEKDGYSSGIYYFRLKTENVSIISKAVLVR